MSISEKNIEEVLFDYVEGNLSLEQRKEVDVFVKNNPQYKDDLEAWKIANLAITEYEFPLKKEIKDKVSKPNLWPYALMGLECVSLFFTVKLSIANIQKLSEHEKSISYQERTLDRIQIEAEDKTMVFKPTLKKVILPILKDSAWVDSSMVSPIEPAQESVVSEKIETLPEASVVEPKKEEPKSRLSKLRQKLQKEDIEFSPSTPASLPELDKQEKPAIKDVKTPMIEKKEDAKEDKKEKKKKEKRNIFKRKPSFDLGEGEDVKVVPLENSGF